MNAVSREQMLTNLDAMTMAVRRLPAPGYELQAFQDQCHGMWQAALWAERDATFRPCLLENVRADYVNRMRAAA